MFWGMQRSWVDMKSGIVVADTGPIFSLAVVDQLDILDELFAEVNIPRAVWEEVTRDTEAVTADRIIAFFKTSRNGHHSSE